MNLVRTVLLEPSHWLVAECCQGNKAVDTGGWRVCAGERLRNAGSLPPSGKVF